jgi:predicted  nucleic acid-binding Zn-ribbon protein
MHDDTARLIVLWTAEQVVDDLFAERTALDVTIEKAKVELERAEENVAGIAGEQVLLRDKEHAFSRRLHTYAKKRDDTRELIDAGRAPDFLLAEQQFEKCAAIADEAETALLELMEVQDETAGRKAGASDVRDLKAHGLNVRQDAKTLRLPGLEEELVTAVDSRDAGLKPIATHLVGRYANLRKKGLTCVVPVQDGNCTGCRMALNRTTFAEHKRGIAVHHCTNCGRFLGELL